MRRCFWVDENSQIYKDYHDNEWGMPKYDDHELFEHQNYQTPYEMLHVFLKR